MKLRTLENIAATYTQYAADRGVEVKLVAVDRTMFKRPGVEFRTLAGSLIWTMENVFGEPGNEFAASVEQEINRMETERFEALRNCKTWNCVESQQIHAPECSIWNVEPAADPAAPAVRRCSYCDDVNETDGPFCCDACADIAAIEAADKARAIPGPRAAEAFQPMPEPKRPIKTERSVRLEVVAIDADGRLVQRDPIGTPDDYDEAKQIVARAREKYGPGTTFAIRRVRTAVETLFVDRPAGSVGPAVTVERWYDRRSRNWIVQSKDVNGNQVGDAGYFGTAADAIRDYMERGKAIAAASGFEPTYRIETINSLGDRYFEYSNSEPEIHPDWIARPDGGFEVFYTVPNDPEDDTENIVYIKRLDVAPSLLPALPTPVFDNEAIRDKFRRLKGYPLRPAPSTTPDPASSPAESGTADVSKL